MSFKLFFASTFGLIKSTAKIEASHEALLSDYRMFCEFEKSPGHKEYHELEVLLNSPTFKQKKKEIQHLSLKGSKEEAQLNEFKKLGRNNRLQKYYTTLKSEELKRFAKISGSGLADKFRSLKKYVEGPEFQKEKKNAEARGKKKFETTEAFAKYNELKMLQNSDDLRFYLNFKKSAPHRNYEQIKNSTQRKRFEELQKINDFDKLASKDSKEAGQLSEYIKLRKNSRLQKFYITQISEELKRFGKISDSGLPDTFNALKKYVKGPDFQKEKRQAEAEGKKKFETTEAFAKYNELKQLQNSDDVKFYLNFEKSATRRNYEQMKNSVERNRFDELHKINDFDKLASKDSKEAGQLSEYIKLKKNSHLHKFYATQKSGELKRFEKLSESGLFEKFQALKKYVESIEFQNEKKKAEAEGKKEFETTEAFAELQEFKKLQNSEDVKFYLNFEKSAARRNYEQMKDSIERKRFEELQKITTSDEFRTRVSYLEDRQKWEKTEESVKEKRFAELQKLPQLVNYLKYKNSNAFDFFKKWNLVFEDRFGSGRLDTQKWMTQSYWASQALGQNFSQAGDLHAFTDGKNVSVDGSLKIQVRKEKTKGMQWQIPFGFVEQEFDYTTGIVSTAGSEWWKHGILEAKVKYAPSDHFVDAFYLLGDEGSPQINLVEMGVKNRLGLLSKSSDGIQAECESISGLKPGEFYIFRLEWSAHSLVWKINDREVFVMKHNVPAFKIHLNAASILVSESNSSLPHWFEIDWVRFYQHAKG